MFKKIFDCPFFRLLILTHFMLFVKNIAITELCVGNHEIIRQIIQIITAISMAKKEAFCSDFW